MTTRLEQVHPDVAASLRDLPPDRQGALVHRVALEAVRRTGLSEPADGADLTEWAETADSRGWARDAEGEWQQAEGDFARARAASALRDAATCGSRTGAAEDSLYESIAALGLDAVRRLLGSAD